MTCFVRLRRTGTLFSALALGALLGALPGMPSADAAMRRFGALSLSNLDGDKVSLADLRGKVVVLNFWATWCKPCITEMPQLASIAERYNERGLRVVAASVDEAESRRAVEQFAKRVPKGMEVWVGATLADMQRLEVGEALPVTVLLDRQGNVVQVHRGGFERGDFDEVLENLLGGADPVPEKKKLPGVTEAFAPLGEAPSLSTRLGTWFVAGVLGADSDTTRRRRFDFRSSAAV